MLTCPQSQRSSSGAGAAPSPSCRYQRPPCAQGCPRLPSHCCPRCCCCRCHQGLKPELALGWEGWEAPHGSPDPAQGLASLKTKSWGICWPGVGIAERWRILDSDSVVQNSEQQRGRTLTDPDVESWRRLHYTDKQKEQRRPSSTATPTPGGNKNMGHTGVQGTEMEQKSR